MSETAWQDFASTSYAVQNAVKLTLNVYVRFLCTAQPQRGAISVAAVGVFWLDLVSFVSIASVFRAFS